MLIMTKVGRPLDVKHLVIRYYALGDPREFRQNDWDDLQRSLECTSGQSVVGREVVLFPIKSHESRSRAPSLRYYKMRA